MICKKCGTEIDDDSLFCESCGEDVSDLSDSYYDAEEITSKKSCKNSKRKIWLIIFVLIFIAVILILLYSNGSNKYFNKINDTINNQISNFEFDGKQLIESVEINHTDNTLKCNISSNNIDLNYLNERSVNVQDKNAIRISDIYCVYDLNDKSFSFKDKYRAVEDITPFDVTNSENVYNYSITNCDNSDFIENTIYQFTYSVWFGASEPSNILDRIYYKENKDKLKQEVKYTSYFLYKNERFEPIFPYEVAYESINAVWNGSELYNAKYENGTIVYGEVIRAWKG